mmetsp:Transcript_293/g.653  ORF Transcript_293/g.653 Transcript_293/m.653 type:complete len:84 (-) Transcript_293:319-570(-)
MCRASILRNSEREKHQITGAFCTKEFFLIMQVAKLTTPTRSHPTNGTIRLQGMLEVVEAPTAVFLEEEVDVGGRTHHPATLGR